MFPVYTLLNNGVVIATAISALQLKAGVNGPIEILRAWATQANNVTGAQCSVALLRKTAAATVTAASAGSTLTKGSPLFPTADASLGTAATGITASAEGTDGEILHAEGMYNIGGVTFLPTPEERWIVPQGGIVALKFLDAPASAKWYCGIRFRELRAG